MIINQLQDRAISLWRCQESCHWSKRYWKKCVDKCLVTSVLSENWPAFVYVVQTRFDIPTHWECNGLSRWKKCRLFHWQGVQKTLYNQNFSRKVETEWMSDKHICTRHFRDCVSLMTFGVSEVRSTAWPNFQQLQYDPIDISYKANWLLFLSYTFWKWIFMTSKVHY